MNDPFDEFAAILVGGYLLMVFHKGNHGALPPLLMQEKRYVEFVIAGAAIYYLVKYDRSGIAAPLVALSGLATALHFAGFLDLTRITEKFARGEAGLFDTIKSVIGR